MPFIGFFADLPVRRHAVSSSPLSGSTPRSLQRSGMLAELSTAIGADAQAESRVVHKVSGWYLAFIVPNQMTSVLLTDSSAVVRRPPMALIHCGRAWMTDVMSTTRRVCCSSESDVAYIQQTTVRYVRSFGRSVCPSAWVMDSAVPMALHGPPIPAGIPRHTKIIIIIIDCVWPKRLCILV